MSEAFVDSREPDEVRLKTARGNAVNSVTYQTKQLPQADFYLPEHDVAIERKEASDFASSTTEGRLSEQADRMIDEHDHVYLIIENDIGQYFGGDKHQLQSLYNLRYSDVSHKSIIGMQTSLAVKRGIKIIYTESVEQTVYAVQRVFERHLAGEAGDGDSHVKTADAGEIEDTQVAMLMQVDGISEEKARGILREISFDELANCATDVGYEGPHIAKESVKCVDGIGGVLAERVINAFQ